MTSKDEFELFEEINGHCTKEEKLRIETAMGKVIILTNHELVDELVVTILDQVQTSVLFMEPSGRKDLLVMAGK